MSKNGKRTNWTECYGNWTGKNTILGKMLHRYNKYQKTSENKISDAMSPKAEPKQMTRKTSNINTLSNTKFQILAEFSYLWH